MSEMTGAELAMTEVIDGLTARGMECRVVVPKPGGLVAHLESRGVECYIYPFYWWVSSESLRGLKSWIKPLVQMRRRWAEARQIAKMLASWKPDVVVTNTVCIVAGAFAAWKLGSAHVWYVHEFGSLDHGYQFILGRSLSLFVMNRYSDAVIYNSQAVAQYFSDGIPADKRHVIWYPMKPPVGGAEGSTVARRCERTLNCVMVGRVAPPKRQEDAVVAVGQLAAASA
jgi:hypothetical protein